MKLPPHRFLGTHSENHWPNTTEDRILLGAVEKGQLAFQLSVLEKQGKPSLYSHSNLGPMALESLQAPGQKLSIQCSLFVISVLTCFGKVFPVITEIFEEGDTLTPRVVPPRCLQKHHLHTSSKPQTGMWRAGLGMEQLRGKVKPLIPTSL